MLPPPNGAAPIDPVVLSVDVHLDFTSSCPPSVLCHTLFFSDTFRSVIKPRSKNLCFLVVWEGKESTCYCEKKKRESQKQDVAAKGTTEEKKKIQRGGYAPEGKIVGSGEEVGAPKLYSMLETCNHLKEDKVEARTLLEPHLIKTQDLIETLVPKQTFPQMKRKWPVKTIPQRCGLLDGVSFK